MKWYVGVDGGGTKTDFALSAADGILAASLKRPGCSYQSIGVEEAVVLVADGVRELLASVGAGLEDCAGCCVGMPCCGENAEQDAAIAEMLHAALTSVPIRIVNDVEVGWAGALECHEGIHIVAGTGSIAFGRDRNKKTARCGGWTEFFGDEGSCYWIGRQAMSLFSKEADGRAPRGALYELVRREYGFDDDYRFVDVVMRDLAPYREAVAGFQRLALQAAQAGDASAAKLYETAASELALMAKTLKDELQLTPGETAVSYSGGLFQAGKFILEPLKGKVGALGCVLWEPRRTAVEGALILAIEEFNGRK